MFSVIARSVYRRIFHASVPPYLPLDRVLADFFVFPSLYFLYSGTVLTARVSCVAPLRVPPRYSPLGFRFTLVR